MKTRSPFTLVGLVILIGFLFYIMVIYTHWMIATNPIIYIEFGSFLIVCLPALALYFGAFYTFWDKSIKLQIFKIRLFQEIVLQLGIAGTLIGIAYMAVGVAEAEGMEHFIPQLGAGLSTSLISLFYAISLALLCYLIEKRLIVKGEGDHSKSPEIKPGLNLRSILGLVVFLWLLFAAVFIQGAAVGTDPIPIFLSIQVLCFLATVPLISIVIYGGKTTLRALRLLFWRIDEDDATLLSMLAAIRGKKRIIAFLGLIFGLMTIISGLRTLGWEIESSLILSANFSSILFWCLLLIISFSFAEGQVVQQIYLQTGEIHHEDRLFIVKFVLPPFLLLYFSWWLTILFLLFV